jgi:hypothetical protein
VGSSKKKKYSLAKIDDEFVGNKNVELQKLMKAK